MMRLQLGCPMVHVSGGMVLGRLRWRGRLTRGWAVATKLRDWRRGMTEFSVSGRRVLAG